MTINYIMMLGLFLYFPCLQSVLAEQINATYVETRDGPSLMNSQCIYETLTGFRFSIIENGVCPSNVYYNTATNGVQLPRSLSNNGMLPLNTDPFGLGDNSNDLFDSEKLLSLPFPSMQFGKQLLMQAMKQQQRSISKETEKQIQIATVSEQINGMRTTSEWMNASLAERKSLYEVWLKDKYLPAIMGVEDTELRSALLFLPEKILKPDIINLEILCKKEGKKIKGC